MSNEPIDAGTLRKTAFFLRAAILESRTLDAGRFHAFLLTLDADPQAVVAECRRRGWLRGPGHRLNRETLQAAPARYELLDALTTAELEGETPIKPTANLGRELYGLPSWAEYPFADRPQRLPPEKPPFTFNDMLAGERYRPPEQTTREGAPAPGGTVRLERAGVAVELYFPTDADKVTLAAALPGCDLDAPPWHAVQTRLVTAGLVDLSAGWERLTAPAAVALLARTATPPAAHSPPGTKQDEGTGNTPPAPGETVDGFGNVTNPRDPTAYVAATVIRRQHTPAALATTYKQFRAILDKHPEIRRWHERRNRLWVHLADWTKYVQGETSKLDGDGLLADELEIEARTAEIRRRKTPGK